MTADEPSETYGSLPPQEALSLLGNEVRAAILWTLSEARGGRGPPPTLSFSELRERTGVDGDSSQFNYHLQQLVGQFVERVDETDVQPVPEMAGEPDAGYRLRPEGTTLTRMIRAWSVAGGMTVEPFEIGQSCYHCDAPLIAWYENAVFAIRCPDCEYVYDYNLTPPGVLGSEAETVADDEAETVASDEAEIAASDEADLLARVAEYNRAERLAFARGSCPLCGNDVWTRFQDPAETTYPRGDLREALVNRGCDHCGHKDNLTVGEAVLADAGLVAFCHERGLDVTTTPIWELEFAATDRHTTVRSTDPWEVAVDVTLDGETLTLVVDEDLAVVERTRNR